MAPEILPAWALNQRLAAMAIRDLYNEAKGVFVLPLSEYVHETRTGSKEESCGIWKSVKEWFSLSEMKEAASQGGYSSGIYREIVKRPTSMDVEAWALRDYGRIPSCGAC